MNSFIIPVPREFDFDHCKAFLQRSPHELLHVCSKNGVIKFLEINNQPVLFEITLCDALHLRVEVLNTELTKTIQDHLEFYVRAWFDLDTDLDPFYKLASDDELLGDLVKRFYGYRIVGQSDLFESLVWAVLGQQINLQFAYTLKQRFIEWYGKQFVFNGNAYYLFPTPSQVINLSDNDLLELQFSRQKSKYTIGIAEAFMSGSISKEKIGRLSFKEAKEELIKIKGIGNWTANYALMKTFRYRDAFPVEDVGLHNAIKNSLGLTRKPTIEEVKKLFERYKGWEAYATLYLWKSL